MSLQHLKHGIVIIDGNTGFYYTPPDTITRCIMISDISAGSNIKHELHTLVKEAVDATYQELLSASTSFKLALFRYQSENTPVNITEHKFSTMHVYSNNYNISYEQYQKWSNFFQKTKLSQILAD